MTKFELIENLCTGYSTQSKTANQFWLALIISSVIALTGRIESKGMPTDSLIQLPFTLGGVNAADFYTISIILISVLLIAFDAAMIQAIRARMLIQKGIEQLEPKYIHGIHIQDYVDSRLAPTYNRVAPIAQFLSGKKQFFEPGVKQGALAKRVGVVFYFLLKAITYFLMYGIPLFAVCRCWNTLKQTTEPGQLQIPELVLGIVILFAIISTVILLWGDIRYLYRVIKRIKSGS